MHGDFLSVKARGYLAASRRERCAICHNFAMAHECCAKNRRDMLRRGHSREIARGKTAARGRSGHNRKNGRDIGPGPVAVPATIEKMAGTLVPASGSQEEPGEDPAAAV